MTSDSLPGDRTPAHVLRRHRNGATPLSYQQRRLWFVDQLVPENPAYVIYTPFLIRGRLDRDALAAAIAEIARRHEILRSAFRSSGDDPVQVVQNVTARDIVRTMTLTDAGQLGDVLSAEARRGFFLPNGPLFRALITEISLSEHAVILAAHHAAVDGWSLSVIMRELSELYRAFAAGKASPLPEPGLQYSDFCWWQRDLPSAELDEHRRYWLRELEGCPTILNLPTDRPRPAVQRFRGKSWCWDLPDDLSEQVRAWCRSRGVTLFMGLLAAFCVLLYRYCEQNSIVVGIPVAGRTRVEWEDLVGFFANTLALRANLGADTTAAGLVAQLRDRSLDAQEHQDMPFELLVDELKAARETSHNPVFQVLFAFQNTPRAPIQLDGLECQAIDVENDTAKFDLSLHFSTEPGQNTLSGLLEYNTDLFEEATIRRMAGHYERLLCEMIVADDRPVGALPMLTPDERRELVGTVNDTAKPVPHRTLDELIAEQAARTPAATAVTCPDASGIPALTFGELEARTDQLAARLSGLGARRGDVVAVCIPRSAELIIALGAILKCGCVYCPLDGDLPADRLTYMLTDSASRIVVTTRAGAVDLPAGVRELRLTPDTWASPAATWPHEHTPDDAGYLIYTSGTTGRPKGTLVSHKAAVNRLLWMRDHYQIGPVDTILHKTPCGFDVSMWELVLPLITGATMVILPPGDHRDPARIAQVLKAENVTVAHFVPSALSSFLDQPDLPGLPALRCVFSSGEALPRTTQDRFCRQFAAALHNLYGPTEAAIDVTWWECDPRKPSSDSVPIGYPVANTAIYVLDRWLNPVPVGVPGELYLGGVQLAFGYCGKPDVTAARFVADPVGGRPGERLYRTGDLVRYRPDLSLEFLGRTDHQVKIRGFRIEPAEIEHTLAEHPAIGRTLVMLTARSAEGASPEADPGQLTAYIVPAAEPDPVLHSAQADSYVGHWAGVWDATYADVATSREDTGIAAAAGWVDSYLGRPFPADEMAEYVSGTAALVGSVATGAVLEIGAGSGLIMAGLAGHAREYWATDLSATAVSALQKLARAWNSRGERTVIRQQAAADMTGIPEGYFDAVVLSSTVQYFPSVGYLTLVLDLALSRLRPGGRLVISDVRNLSLADAFYASVELARAGAELPPPVLADRVRRRQDDETELLIDPGFFDEFCGQRAGVTAEVRLKSGKRHNELTKFRYDVIIYRSDDRAVESAFTDQPWSRFERDPRELWRHLAAGEPERLVARAVPDRRTLADVLRAESLAGMPETMPEGAFRAQDPDDMAERAAALGYQMAAWWAGRGRFDAVFWKEGPPPLAARGRASGSARLLVNDPLQAQRQALLSESARTWAKQRLPEYMVPAAFVVLDEFPVGPNGKIDRRALPAPGRARSRPGHGSRPPATPLERHLAVIWAQLLGLDQVGLDDNFFELGGDSIMSVRVVNRARDEGIALTVREFFDHPTVAGLAGLLEGRGASNATRPDTAWLDLLPGQHEQLADGRVVGQVKHGITAARPLRADRLATALEFATRIHDALRLTIEPGRQRVLPALDQAGAAVRVVQADGTGTDPSPAASDGSLATLVLRDGADEASEFDLWVNPLVFDRTSVWLLLRTVETAYLSLEAGKVPDPPRPGASYASLCDPLPAGSPQDRHSVRPTPSRGQATPGPSRQVYSLRLPAEPLIELLTRATAVYGNQVEDILLTALACAWPGQAGRGLVARLDRDQRSAENASRPQIADVIGPFTVSTRVPLPRPNDDQSAAEILRVVKESLRTGTGPGPYPAAALRLRYVDERPGCGGGTLFGPREDDHQRDYDFGGDADELTLTVRVLHDSLSMRWSLPSDASPGVDIERLAADFSTELTALLKQCAEREIGGFVAGQFPLVRLSAEQLRELSDRYPAVEDVYPLGPFQRHQAQWLLHDPRHGIYLVWVTHTLDGLALDPEKFIAAWQDLMDRHAALRTGFLWADRGQAVQIVHRGAQVPVDYLDLRDRPAPEQEAFVNGYIQALSHHRLDLSGGLQWRLGLFRVDDDRYRFIPRFSYMLQDGWTFSIFMEELFACYEARLAGASPDLAPLRPYRDHIAALQLRDQREAAEFWPTYLQGAVLPTPLTSGIISEYGHGAESSGDDFQYRTEGVVLDKTLEHALRAFARRHRLTLFTLLAGAWAVLMSRYSGVDDVVFGTVSSGRSAAVPGIEQMTGSFNNILPVRVWLPRQELVTAWLRDVQAAAQAATRFEQTSLTDIKRVTGFEERRHLFESYLVFENFPMGRRFGQILAEWNPGTEGATQSEHPLRVFIWPVGQFTVEISYYDNVFARSTIEKLLSTYVECLASLIQDAGATVESLLGSLPGRPGSGTADDR
ncbi:MAG TPA: amino acid adenylation domain-containing protein [Streptosporangiaceae bacterium]